MINQKKAYALAEKAMQAVEKSDEQAYAIREKQIKSLLKLDAEAMTPEKRQYDMFLQSCIVSLNFPEEVREEAKKDARERLSLLAKIESS